MADLERRGKSVLGLARVGFLFALTCASDPNAQTACPAPLASDFKVVDLTMTGLSQHTDMELAPDGRIFISEIYTGEIKIFRGGVQAESATGRAASIPGALCRSTRKSWPSTIPTACGTSR